MKSLFDIINDCNRNSNFLQVEETYQNLQLSYFALEDHEIITNSSEYATKIIQKLKQNKQEKRNFKVFFIETDSSRTDLYLYITFTTSSCSIFDGDSEKKLYTNNSILIRSDDKFTIVPDKNTEVKFFVLSSNPLFQEGTTIRRMI